MNGSPATQAPAEHLPSDDSYERIIEAALQEMAAHGPTRARMAAIAQRAGVSSATLYRRFAAKRDLMQAVALRETERFVDALREVAARQETAEQTVVETFVTALEYVRENTIVQQLIEAEPNLLLPLFTTDAGPWLEATSALMLQLNEENLFVAENDWQRDLATVRIEMVVRLFLSLLLTPGGTIDVSTPEASREFARRHIVPLVVQADSPQVRRPNRE